MNSTSFMIFMKYYDFILDALPEKEPHLPEAFKVGIRY